MNRILVSVVSALAVGSAALLVPTSAAQAAEFGSGSALIRIDADRATITKKADGSCTLTLPDGGSGQWLGDRPNSKGKMRVRVGNMTAEQLAKSWKDFRYGPSSVQSTLTWKAGEGKPDSALVRIKRPVVSDEGVSFAMTLPFSVDLPKSLKDVSLSLRRADDNKNTRTDYYPWVDINFTSALHYFAGMYEPWCLDTRLYNAGKDNTCWKHTWTGTTGEVVDMEGRCDEVAYKGSDVWKYYNSASRGNKLDLTLTPDGQAAFTYNQWTFVY